MRITSEGRELIELPTATGLVRGTYHRPRDPGYRERLNLEVSQRVGVVFLNGLYATRAGNGNAATYWADSLAEQGYPCFRIDLPGSGDSSGDTPTDVLGFIDAGGYAGAAAEAIRTIIRRFELSGIILVGHCAGGVSAIYAAAEAIRECRGMVLMDPYFHLPQTELPKVRQELNLWARRSRIGGGVSRAFDLYKRIRLVLYQNALPKNANALLLRRWEQVTATGLPVLILKAPSRGAASAKPRMGEFDYFNHVIRLAGSHHRVRLRVVDAANHSFSNQEGRLAVRQEIEGWLEEYFPLTIREPAVSSLTAAPSLEEAS